MSADNYIAVAEFPKGYAVWMGFMSDDDGDTRYDGWVPTNACWFGTAKEAVAYAQDWYQNETVVEYGLSIAPDVMAELTR